jgi:hypothetical protein
MRGSLLVVVAAAALFASGANGGTRLGVYAGHSKYTTTLYVTVNLQVRSSTSADFGIGASAPCDKYGYDMGRTVNTYEDPARPRLRLHDGRFSLTHHATFTTVGVQIVTTNQTYVLTGHATPAGFVGTARIREVTNTGITCDTGTVGWTAHWVNAPFPK